MSRAFVRESDQDTIELPDQAISAHANCVTPRGLAAIESQLRELVSPRARSLHASEAGEPVPYQGEETELVSIEP